MMRFGFQLLENLMVKGHTQHKAKSVIYKAIQRESERVVVVVVVPHEFTLLHSISTNVYATNFCIGSLSE
jgi:hypothetical protein